MTEVVSPILGQQTIYDQLAPTHGSLFSGYGGIDIAVAEAFGARTAWVSDIDPGPCKVLERRFPGVPNLGDITKIDWADVEPVDILSGGSPCQDLSAAGRRAGMTEGTRSNLWVQMREAIATLRPKLVVWENVMGALSARAASELESVEGRVGDGDGGPVLRALGRVLGDLAEIGFDAEWATVRASDVGAPTVGQGSSSSPGRPALLRTPCAAEADGGAVESVCGEEGGEDVAADGADHRHVSPRDAGDVTLLPTPKAGDADFGLPRTSGRPPERSTHLATRLHYTDFGSYGPAIERWERATGRPAPDPTKPSPKTGKPQLSAEFVEWMMGLPSGWFTSPEIGLTRVAALKIGGNGVVPQQAEFAIRGLMGRIEVVS